MSFCEKCNIEEKLTQCCGRFPMTGEKTAFSYGTNVTLPACRHLSPGGFCSIYESRPQGCREFFCDAYLTGSKARFRNRAFSGDWPILP